MSHDRQQKASDGTPNMEHSKTPSPDLNQTKNRESRRKTRQRSPETEVTRKSQKTTDLSNERTDVPSTDNASTAGPSITCKHLL